MKTFKIGESQIPALGLGTWKSESGKVYDAVREAIKVGYRHIDCAAIYGNEKEVGEALSDAFAEGDVTREELWVTSKLWNDAHVREDVRPALMRTLKNLQLDYLDLYLIHWPIAFVPKRGMASKREDFLTLDQAPLSVTWEELISARKEGLVKHIGVSNFNPEQLEGLKRDTGVMPEMLQVEIHPYFNQRKLIKFAKKNKIAVTAYAPIGSGSNDLFEDEVIVEISKKHDASPAQVMLSWAIGRGTIPIPKSTNARRIAENFNALNVELSKEEIKSIEGIDKNKRYIDGSFFTGEESPYELEDIWGK